MGSRWDTPHRDDARRAAARAELRPGEATLQAINRLEDERGAIWAAGVASQRQRDRLDMVNDALSGLWAIRREQRAGQQGRLEPATAHRNRGAWQVDPWASYLEDAV